jgi:hypothetical protein
LDGWHPFGEGLGEKLMLGVFEQHGHVFVLDFGKAWRQSHSGFGPSGNAAPLQLTMM